MDRWITDTKSGTRFKLFTRANADEVGPEPFSPLGWSLGWVKGNGPGAADGFVTFGVVKAEELAPDHQIFGNWGGYFYNSVSLSRLLGVRMPGVSVDAIDKAYFGDQPGIPPYEPDPADEDPERSEALAATLAWVMSTDSCPAMQDQIERSRRVRSERPDFAALDDHGLVGYARRVTGYIREAWGPYCEVVLAASIGPGAVGAICEALGRGSDAVKLFTGIGGVESAGGSIALWDLSRRVRSSPTLSEAFDAGLDGLLGRLRAAEFPDASSFVEHLDGVLEEYGHRGPNEWDLSSPCWATNPELALGMVDRVRFQSDDHDPRLVSAKASEERRRISAEIDTLLESDPETQATFNAGLRSGTLFYQMREAGKSAVIRLHYEAKVTLMELGRRLAQRGYLSDPGDVFMLLDHELEEILDAPSGWAAKLAERRHAFGRLATLEPPYIVDSRVGPPPIDQWPTRGGASNRKLSVGDILRGAAGAPGKVSGTARVVFDPSNSDLEPGDVLVCRTTDPSWAPLFLATSAVVCDVGAVGSHAAIVAREIGVPCAVSVVDATKLIPDGATISVDGSSGEVEILSLP